MMKTRHQRDSSAILHNDKNAEPCLFWATSSSTTHLEAVELEAADDALDEPDAELDAELLRL